MFDVTIRLCDAACAQQSFPGLSYRSNAFCRTSSRKSVNIVKITNINIHYSLPLKGLCHEAFGILDQLCAEIIT